MSEEYKTRFESDLPGSDTAGSEEPQPSAPSLSSDGSIQITLSKDKIITGFVVLEFILILAMGWQLMGIKSQLEGGDVKVAKADTPSVVDSAPNAAPTAAAFWAY